MDKETTQIIIKLKELNLETARLLQQLEVPQAKSTATPVSPIHQSKTTDNTVKKGDTVILLSNGLGRKIRNGDKAIVTEVKGDRVHFKVSRNGVSSYKKLKNVKKV
jgi:hypothetical protein